MIFTGALSESLLKGFIQRAFSVFGYNSNDLMKFMFVALLQRGCSS